VSDPVDQGVLFVISAPSGTGKTTVARRLVAQIERLEFSVSYTTRPMRAGEAQGVDYHFVDRSEFESMQKAGEFLESADVFGRMYGTGLQITDSTLKSGVSLMLDVDIQGAQQIRKVCGPNRAGVAVPSVTILLVPPSYQTLHGRLASRATESGGELGRRLAEAYTEVSDFANFDYVVINDDLDKTVCELEAIITAERLRPARMFDRVQRIIAGFPRKGQEA